MEGHTTASLKLLATLIKHYTKVIEEEKQALEETLKVTTKIKEITKRETHMLNYREN